MMPLYSYSAIGSDGKKKNGILEAESEREAKEQLRRQGAMVTKIEVKSKVTGAQNFSSDQLSIFTIQLSQLVGAGIPLYEGLVALEEQSRNEKYHRILLSLCEQIKRGRPLSEAMAGYPESFDRLYCAMVKAGESSGALALVLEKLSQFLTKRGRLKKQLATAMIYPAVLGGFCLILIFMLLTFVVPSIEGIFADRELNSFTEFVIASSHFFQNYWWLYLPLTAAAVTYGVINARSPSGRTWLQRKLLKVPVVKTLIIHSAVARFSRTMGTLQVGGLPMIDSLRIARGVVGNIVIEEEIQRIEERVVEGSSLSGELMRTRWIPPMAARMLAVGEESGSIAVMFNKVADLYEDEVEKSLDRLMGLAQPVILILMGTLIGAILMAILLPLTDVSSFTM